MSIDLINKLRNEDTNEDKSKEEKFDIKVPFDMKSFWKNLNEKYFRKVENINEINHLLNLYSRYDLHNDKIFAKIGFPRNLNSLLGKYADILSSSRKNNLVNVTKFFGMNVYIDNFDYLINNINSRDIDEEIQMIQEKLNSVEENNYLMLKNFENKSKLPEFLPKVDINSKDFYINKCENLANQIFTLQTKQFAESIWNIKIDVKNKKYLLIFEEAEGIENLSLNEEDYKKLLTFRDPLNSISVYDLFQEKIHSYYNNGSSTNKEAKSQEIIKRKRGRPKINKCGKKEEKEEDEETQNSTLISRKKEKLKKNNTKNIVKVPRRESVEIAKKVSVDYEFCHHCKQRKPAEVMIKCTKTKNKFVDIPVKTFYVNNTTCVKKFFNFIITNFSGDPNDILDGYLNKKILKTCGRTFCSFCLKGSYDQIIENIKNSKDWVCPCCVGNCYCTRCIRYDQMLKLLSLYISYNGNMNELKTNLENKSAVLKKLSDHMLISNIIIINNDPVNKNNKNIKEIEGSDCHKLQGLIDQTNKLKNELVSLKNFFDTGFDKIRKDKINLTSNNKIEDMEKAQKKSKKIQTKKVKKEKLTRRDKGAPQKFKKLVKNIQ